MGDLVVSLVAPVLGQYSAGQAHLRCFFGLWPDFPKSKVELFLTGGLIKSVCTHKIFQLH